MKPTQEQILRALNKLVRENKTELKAEKIELGILDSTEKQIGKIYDDIQRVKGILSGAGDEAERISKNAMLKADTQLETIQKAEKMAKELGVDIPEIADFKKRLTNASELGKELTKKSIAAQKV